MGDCAPKFINFHKNLLRAKSRKVMEKFDIDHTRHK